MKPQQLILRLESLIHKDKQRINGYRLASFNSKTRDKRFGYLGVATSIQNSIVRKMDALEFVKNDMTDRSWDYISEMFGFSGR